MDNDRLRAIRGKPRPAHDAGLSIEETIDRFLMTKEETSIYHSNDLSGRLKKWAETMNQTQPIHTVTKQEIETYLAQYSGQNSINHRAALF